MVIKRAVIPVAGFGTRMLPITKAVPKEMIALVDKPIIHYAVQEAIEAGITDIIFITSKSKSAIEDYFDRFFELENALKVSGKENLLQEIVDITEKCKIVSVRQKEQKGLGHAILQAESIVGDEPFAVMLPDDLFLYEKPIIGQMIEVYNKLKAPVVALQKVPVDETNKYGIVSIKEKLDDSIYQLKSMVEKPKSNPPSDLAIVGRYILNRDILEQIEKTGLGALGEIQLTDAINEIAINKSVYGYIYVGNRFDCGHKAGYIRAFLHFAYNRKDLREDFIKVLKELGL
ncbi:MAG: UTP--glucose-1-phosphate uridylyltransferase GalU [Deferribacterales bacterium]|nr:UTP--glucose-1-phosphate uridylyltransferase GalU [Deferribacterales bacterium]